MARREDRDPNRRAGSAAAGDSQLDDLYSVEYLAEVAGGDARAERLEELKRRIALGAYKPDAESIAADMLARVGIDSEDD